MKKLTLALIAILTLILTACSTSNNVTSSHSIQKRKYTKGFFLEKNTKSFAQQNKKSKKHTSTEEDFISKREIITTETIGKEEQISQVDLVENTKSNIVLDEGISNHSNIVDQPISGETDIYTIEYKEEVNINNQTPQASNKVHNSDESGDGKSQIVALILVLLVGVFGVHRMYLGYVGIGILQLLTLGFCGIWTLVDLILIITGDLKPKGGDYTDKLE